MTLAFKFGKRGAINDVFLIIALLFVLGIFFILMKTIFNEIKPELQEELGDRGDRVLEIADDTLAANDYFFAFYLIGLFLFLIISSFLIDSNPALFFIGLIMLVISLIVAPVFANTFTQFTGEDELSQAASEYPITNFIFDHYPEMIMVMGFVTAIILYGKFKSGGA